MRISKSASYYLATKRKPRGSFDFETWDWVNPRAVGFMWGPKGARERKIFIDRGSMHPEVIAQNALWFMAIFPGEVHEWWGHNAGKFDSLFILQAAGRLGWKCRAHIAGGRIITLKITGPHGEFKIHDSYAVVQSKLGDAAESFNLPSRKLLSDEDYNVDVRQWSVERITDGCYADCEVVLDLLDVVETMFENEGGRLKPTFSSSALTVVAAHAPILDMRALQTTNMTCRQAYMGGRVEVYRHTPKYSLREWDINSSYPHSMAQALPYQFLAEIVGSREVGAVYRAGIDGGVIEAKVKVPDCYLPVLPYRHPKYGGIYFPTGEWRGFFDSEELRYAESCGTIIKEFCSMQVFTREKVFERFITSFYDLKSKSTGAAREFYKLCLNGCYGKFAQKPEIEEIHCYATDIEAQRAGLSPKYKNSANFRPLSAYDMRYVAISSERWHKQTHYALASAITAQSRISLHRYLSSAERLAYTDTDSIHAASNTSRLTPFETNRLGDLKVELADFSAVYAAPKIYGLKDNRWSSWVDKKTKEKHEGYREIYKSKGFPVSEESFRAILEGKKVETNRIQLAKRQLINGNDAVRLKLDGRSWKGMSSKRRPIGGKDGDTAPWTVEELKADTHLTDAAISPLAHWRFNK